MKQVSRVTYFLWQVPALPLAALSLSRGKRLLIVAISYALGIAGLWFFLPFSHNALSMALPIISVCWLFRYRGLLICIPLILIAFALIVLFQLPYAFNTDQSVPVKAVIGLGVGLLLGLVICWLRTAVNLVNTSRSHAQDVEQEYTQSVLAYEYQCKLNELKDQILLNISHELCTPLTVVGGYLELLKEYNEYLGPDERLQMLEEALKSKEDLNDLINRVLDTTQMASDFPQAQSETVNIHQFLEDTLAHLAPFYMQNYTILLKVPEQLSVWADPQFLRQVLNNLLSNISKYVPPQTRICIEVEQAECAAPVRLSIQDEGPGIPAEELPLLFEKFVRLKRDQTGSKRGMGLGLYVCKQLIIAMGGHIWVESAGREGQGSRFCLILPSSSPLKAATERLHRTGPSVSA